MWRCWEATTNGEMQKLGSAVVCHRKPPDFLYLVFLRGLVNMALNYLADGVPTPGEYQSTGIIVNPGEVLVVQVVTDGRPNRWFRGGVTLVKAGGSDFDAPHQFDYRHIYVPDIIFVVPGGVGNLFVSFEWSFSELWNATDEWTLYRRV